MIEKLDEKIQRKSYKKAVLDDDSKPAVTTIRFKTKALRQKVEDFHTNIGFTTFNDYIMALIRVSMKDADVLEKLKNELKDHF